MSLRNKFILLTGILHLLALVLSFVVFKEQPELFIAAELLLLITAALSWQLYRQMIRPLQTLARGTEAIKSKEFTIKFRPTGTYEMDRLIDVYNQMMDQLRQERTRQEQQHFFLEKLIQTSPTGILILDFDGRVQQANPSACALLGIPEAGLLNRQAEVIDSHLAREIGTLNSSEDRTVSPDGVHTYKLQRSHFIDRGFARSFVMIEELTAEILTAEKKAYGKVIRMMAHEVNNTVGPVNSIIDSALKAPGLWQPGHSDIEQALRVAFERNRNLNVFMRNFADVVRLPEPRLAQLDLHGLVRNVATLFGSGAAGPGLQLDLELPDSPFMMQADQQQLEQALINIVKNAVEAAGPKGRILIATDPGAGLLAITDSGPGISNEHAEQLFSPFFSTKKDGQGVGLTLVKEILLSHGCEFSLKTEAPGRTVFRITFGKF